ncbi:MAG: helix-turn-helix domain-containing protein, partial [Alphaproteobacteria bacterium]|nr:helix-turn-helix domain-containing protein [Alphaproteobacteria bacterium]
MAAGRTATAQRDAAGKSEAGKALRWRLGRWLKQQREAAGLTQADLAERLGLRYYSFISQVEGGYGRIPQALYIAWADALA